MIVFVNIIKTYIEIIHSKYWFSYVMMSFKTYITKYVFKELSTFLTFKQNCYSICEPLVSIKRCISLNMQRYKKRKNVKL